MNKNDPRYTKTDKTTKRGKPGVLQTAHLYTRWVQLVVMEKYTTADATTKVAEEYGLERYRVVTMASKGDWNELSKKLLPALRGLEPTSTTALDVVDKERKSYLNSSRLMAKCWTEGMEYYAEQFHKAKETNNTILASEMLQDMGRFSLFIKRAQEISQHSTCDSGAATAITETSGQPQGNAINLYISQLMATPRISQPGAAPIEFEVMPADSFPAQGNGK